MYNSNNVAERIKLISMSKGISIKKLLEDVGLGFNTMSNMKNSMPKADNLAKVADYLDCSIDYFLGRTENPTSHKACSPDNIVIGEEKEIIDFYNNMNEDGRKALRDYIEYISTKVEYKKSSASQQNIG